MYEATSTANTAAEADVESFSGSRSNSNPITEMIHQLQEEIIQLKHAISSRPSSYSSSSSSYSGGRSWSTATAVALPLTVFDFAYYVLLGVLILYLLEGISPGGRRG
jgi:tetrahydromethanopterin S-methyltransferase subunit E